MIKIWYAPILQLFAGEAAKSGGESGEITAEADAGQQNSTASEGADEFSELIEGRFKKQFAEKTQSIIDSRFKKTKELESYKSRVEPIVSALCKKYGVEDGSESALAGLIENERLTTENKALTSREEFKKKLGGWVKEGEELKTTYPDFDLRNELKGSRIFGQLIAGGVPLGVAYEVVHKDDILGGAMAYTAKKVREQVVKGIEAKNTALRTVARVLWRGLSKTRG